MHRLVPDFILEKFAAGEMSGEFRAASLFVDISGFSSLTDALMDHGQHGAELLAGIMRAVFEPLLRSVYEQGGFTVTLAGDAFTALFPLDNTQEQGYPHSLAAAAAIQERMAAVAVQDIPGGTFSLAVKVGVATGAVDWGIVISKDGSRAAQYFRGTAIDDCAAAEHAANPGEVVLTPDFYSAVKELVAVESVADSSTLGDYYRLTAVNTPLPPAGYVNLSPVDLDIAARFYPSTLVSQSYSGEFRHVVNLFISLPTVRTEAQLAIFMQSLFALQDRYDGLLNRLDFGDKGSHLLLFWGAPVAYENDIERALNFILDLQTQTSIPINAGVTYHIAHAGFIGSSLREEYTCFGRGVNLAARFMTHAARGEIWLDEAVAQRAELNYDLAFEGAMNFKGFSEPQKVYVLFERREEVEALFQGALVGRSEELTQLNKFVAPLWEGHYAGVMLIRGEAGIGKSRLAYAFLTVEAYQVSQTGQVFRAQADEILQGALDPFRYWLRRYFGQSQSQSEARNKRNFNRTLDRLIDNTSDETLAAELDRTRSFLGALVDLRWSDSLYEQLEPEGRHENTTFGLISLLQAESLQRPVVLHLEDAHWMDDASRAFLTRLIRVLSAEDSQSFPIAIIITTRPLGRSKLLDEEINYQEINLGQLSQTGLARLVEEQLGGPVTPRLLQFLAERAEGNPFFLEQILHYLKERDFLVMGEAGWQIAHGTDVISVPTDVRALLVARLDQLTLQVKEVVQTASVLGREFEIRVLARMLQDDKRLLDKIADAEQAAIWTALNEVRYIFHHALLRDAAYQMQLRVKRQALHTLAMTSLENLSAAGVKVRYAELAYHAEAAGLTDKATTYLQKAGDAARDAYENSLAIEYYSRALALVASGDWETRYLLMLAREEMWHLQGKRDEQLKDLAALREAADESHDLACQAEVALRRSQYDGATGEHQSAITAAQQGVSYAMEVDRVDLAARGCRLWGWYLMRQGAYDDSQLQLQQALDYARVAGNLKLEADCLNSLGALFQETGEFAAALEHYQQARALYQKAGNWLGESSTWNNQGGVAYAQGKYADAIPYYERALAIRRQIGALRREGNTLYNLGAANRALGRYSEARACYQGSLAIVRQVGDRRGEGLVLNSLGLLASNFGDYAIATANCEKSLEIFQNIGDRALVATAHTNLGSFAVGQGAYEKAETHYQSAFDFAREIGISRNEGYALFGLGEVMLGWGRLEEAAAYFEASSEIWKALDWSGQITESQSGLARVALAQGDPSRAVMLVEEILPKLDTQSLAGSEQSFRIYLTCVQVLSAQQDPRASVVLRKVYDQLQEQAARITDDALRHAFLHNVPEHRQLLDFYQTLLC